MKFLGFILIFLTTSAFAELLPMVNLDISVLERCISLNLDENNDIRNIRVHDCDKADDITYSFYLNKIRNGGDKIAFKGADLVILKSNNLDAKKGGHLRIEAIKDLRKKSSPGNYFAMDLELTRLGNSYWEVTKSAQKITEIDCNTNTAYFVPVGISSCSAR